MTYYKMSREELYHHGILGQRWGVRRYQNEDGSLTAAGRRRYSEEERRINDDYSKLIDEYEKKDEKRINGDDQQQQQKQRKQKSYLTDAQREDKNAMAEYLTYKRTKDQFDKAAYVDPYGDTKQKIANTKLFVNTAQNMLGPEPSGKEKMNLSEFSNDDLQNGINRARLEEQFTNYYGKDKVESSGKSFVRNTLEIAGSALAVASTAVAIASAIKNLRDG